MINYILGIFDPTAALAAQAQTQNLVGDNADIWQMVMGAGLVVQFVLFLLLMFSVIAWGVILSKAKAIWDARRQNDEFHQLFWHANSLSVANSQTQHLESSPLAAIFQLGYTELGRIMRLGEGGSLPAGSMENLRRALSRGKAAEMTSLERKVTFLATCANTAPFIGLFGTVWGIMDAFRSIGSTGAANLATVAPGIAEALVATAFGLFAAIPAVVFYNYFNRRLDVLHADMDSFIQDFLNLVERDIMRRQGSAVESVRPAGV
ncbi:protein TolQ [Dethiosulfatarculus sandiegensis]|nr:protein TolQ [Dethiosulfatarculus sandiegensis]